MSILDISEHTAGSIAGSQVLAEPCIVEQQVNITGVSTPSNPFNEATRLVRVHCDVVCSIAFGKTPVATATNKRLAANQTEVFSVRSGNSVAVIQNS